MTHNRESPELPGWFSALWVAHSPLCASHRSAADRSAASNLRERQAQRLTQSSPMARTWLQLRQQSWPERYRREWWIDTEHAAAPPTQLLSFLYESPRQEKQWTGPNTLKSPRRARRKALPDRNTHHADRRPRISCRRYERGSDLERLSESDQRAHSRRVGLCS